MKFKCRTKMIKLKKMQVCLLITLTCTSRHLSVEFTRLLICMGTPGTISLLCLSILSHTVLLPRCIQVMPSDLMANYKLQHQLK